VDPITRPERRDRNRLVRAPAIAFIDCVKNTDECFCESVLNRAGGHGVSALPRFR
jgi:hypothetical protein